MNHSHKFLYFFLSKNKQSFQLFQRSFLASALFLFNACKASIGCSKFYQSWVVYDFVPLLNWFCSMTFWFIGCISIHPRVLAYHAPAESVEPFRPIREVRHQLLAAKCHHLANQVHLERRVLQKVITVSLGWICSSKLSTSILNNINWLLLFYSYRKALAKNLINTFSRSSLNR